MTRTGHRGAYRVGVERRRAIIDAGFEAFAQHGYARSSLRAIASVAGVTPAGLLHHFPGKEALLQAVLASWSEQHRAIVNDLALGEGIGYFRSLPTLTRRLMNDPLLFQLPVALMADVTDATHPARTWVVQRYDTACAQGVEQLRRAETDGDVRTFSPGRRACEIRGLLAAMDGVVLHWASSTPVDLVELIDALLCAALERWTGVPHTVAAGRCRECRSTDL